MNVEKVDTTVRGWCQFQDKRNQFLVKFREIHAKEEVVRYLAKIYGGICGNDRLISTNGEFIFENDRALFCIHGQNNRDLSIYYVGVVGAMSDEKFALIKRLRSKIE